MRSIRAFTIILLMTMTAALAQEPATTTSAAER
jgi:hypothetical protein